MSTRGHQLPGAAAFRTTTPLLFKESGSEINAVKLKKAGRIERNSEWKVSEVIIAQKGTGTALAVSGGVSEGFFG